MPAPSTTNDLLELVRKSGLIAPERLDDFLDSAGGERFVAEKAGEPARRRRHDNAVPGRAISAG